MRSIALLDFQVEAFDDGDHLFSSASISAAYSSGVLAIGSAPSRARRSRISSDDTAARNSLFSRSMIGRGVPAGADSP